MIIYQAVCFVNKKIYIGKTINDLESRKNRHYSDAFNQLSQTHFHRALRKYGKENFEWKVIHKCKTEKELTEMEIHYIKEMDTLKNGYNLTDGGDGGPSGKYHPMYGNGYKIMGKNNPFFGKHHSKEQKKKWSEDRKGTRMGDENVMITHNIDFSGENNPFYGKTHSIESKNKVGEANSNMWLITHPDNSISVYKNLRKFCTLHNLNYSGVKGAAKNNRIYKNEWLFQKISNYNL